MSITVVVGGQFGGEGKGKVTAHLCRRYGFDIAVRCGGPNSGHTVTIDNRQVVLRQIPAGVVNPQTKLFLAAGCMIDLDILLGEIDSFGLTPSRLRIDPHAVIIDKTYAKEEEVSGFQTRIGSTCTGSGIAVAKRVLRSGDLRLASDFSPLKPYLTNVSVEIVSAHIKGQKVVVEGTQGFGLSVYHSPYYPYATSRDTTAAAFLSEVGVSPLAVSQIVMVIRTFPIRVGGNSGPLPKEVDWGTVQSESGYPYGIQELTSVTKRLRRVARFDLELVKRAIAVNMPTHVALMGADYLDYRSKGVKCYDHLTDRAKAFVSRLEWELGVKIDFVGTGPVDHEIIDMVEGEPYEQEERRVIELPVC